MNFATAYLSQQANAIEKWKSLDLTKHSQLSNLELPVGLIPFSGTRLFDQLSEKQKVDLYRGFVQMICEALIVFEQMLLKTVRSFPTLSKSDPRYLALRVFAREEFFHLRAYRSYLNQNQMGTWPTISLVSRRSPWIKNFYTWLLEFEPLCIFFPGAKSEIFSIQYTKFLCRFPEIASSDWVYLNKVHTADEVHHYGFDFELMNSFLKEVSLLRRSKIVLATYTMSLGIQFIPIISGIRLINQIFTKENRLERARLVLLFFRWSVLKFVPYSSSKLQLRKLFDKFEVPGSIYFRFLTW